MGSWGHQNFENDAAAQYVAEFGENPSETTLLVTLITVVEEEEALEAEVAEEGLVAAEIVAAALGQPGPDFPAALLPIAAKLELGEDPELQEMAQEAVEAILQASGLKDQWNESGKLAQWLAVQTALLARLQ
jgi:hypothetical protein